MKLTGTEGPIDGPHGDGVVLETDAVVVGGGFYGCQIARYLYSLGSSVVLVEKQSDLLTRASWKNQARVHHGYHYPRSFMTGLRSAFNFSRFKAEFADCIESGFAKFYAIARRQSNVTPRQFVEFCSRIGAPVRKASPKVAALFNPATIAEVFNVEEYAFDADKLRSRMWRQLSEARIPVFLSREVQSVRRGGSPRFRIELSNGSVLKANRLFNATYSQLNEVLSRSGLPRMPLKHEIAEIALVRPPEQIAGLGITVMDGPFFSVMPFPALGLHSLSHVRYTPHESWKEPETLRDPQEYLSRNRFPERAVYMIKDAARYLPCMATASIEHSLFEVKTILLENEIDDGRPILLRRHAEEPEFTSILGGKIDNVYDIIEALEELRKSGQMEGVETSRYELPRN